MTCLLVYTVVPFPMAEIQAHLTALFWAQRLPHMPSVLTPPSREPDSDEHTENHTGPDKGAQKQDRSLAEGDSLDERADGHQDVPHQIAKPSRETDKHRGDLVFGYPFEYKYQDYILSLTKEGDGGEQGGWGKVEDWRWALRKDKARRERVLGY